MNKRSKRDLEMRPVLEPLLKASDHRAMVNSGKNLKQNVIAEMLALHPRAHIVRYYIKLVAQDIERDLRLSPGTALLGTGSVSLSIPLQLHQLARKTSDSPIHGTMADLLSNSETAVNLADAQLAFFAALSKSPSIQAVVAKKSHNARLCEHTAVPQAKMRQFMRFLNHRSSTNSLVVAELRAFYYYGFPGVVVQEKRVAGELAK